MSEVGKRLLSRFAAVSQDQQTPVWDQVWQEGITPWDRNGPSPALREALEERNFQGGAARSDSLSRKKKALVPGCGRGYDVALLSSFSFDAYGLDVSATALSQAKKLCANRALFEEKYPLATPGSEYGEIEFLLGDFFTNEPFTGLAADGQGQVKFDVIFDYTFLCALPPPLRPKWARRMSELLALGGTLICVEFPLTKDPSLPGPPHGLTAELYIEILKIPGEDVEYESDGRVRVNDERVAVANGLERINRWKAVKTHQAGTGTDHISLWQHKS